MGNGPHVTPSRFAVVIAVTGIALSGFGRNFLIKPVFAARSATILVSIAVRIINAVVVTFGFNLIAATDMGNSPHVAPCTLAVIVRLTGIAFGGLGLDLITAANVGNGPHIAPSGFAVVVSLTGCTFSGFGLDLIISTDMRNRVDVAPAIGTVSICITRITWLTRSSCDLVTAANVWDGPHVAPGRFTVIICSAGSTFGGFAHSDLLIEEHHSVDSSLHLFA